MKINGKVKSTIVREGRFLVKIALRKIEIKVTVVLSLRRGSKDLYGKEINPVALAADCGP